MGSRKSCCVLVFVFAAFALTACAQTGVDVPELAALDQLILNYMNSYQVGGLAVAITRDGRLVFAHGYGIADKSTGERVQPDSLFRLCSISKTFAGADIARLAQEGRLDLDARVFDVLDHLRPPNGQWGDPRIPGITIRQLLHHTGGWDRMITPDPMLTKSTLLAASQATQSSYPPTAENLIRYMQTQPLNFSPGSGSRTRISDT